jgi:hypothetical protein
VLVLIAVVTTACSGGSDKVLPPTPTSHPPTSNTRPAVPTLAVVLDDTGLHVPAERRPAARYILSFVDRRTHRGKQRVVLALGPSGPPIVTMRLAAGARRSVVLIATIGARVEIDGVPQPHLSAGFNIDLSKEYPTPAT